MEELIGFISSNNRFIKIMNLLESKGAIDSNTIIKNTRIPGIDKNLKELVKKNLIYQKDDKYDLTELGEKVTRKLRAIR